VGVDLGASVVAGAPIRLDAGTAGEAGTAPGGRRRGASGAAGSGRTDASLLAVVERYAAGIRFCYDNELKREPRLRGKLVIAITVAASGEVTDARVVEDTVGSAALSACVLGKIRAWTFPRVPAGTTTFQAPFVFTPPRE
jgi:TonB family protein